MHSLTMKVEVYDISLAMGEIKVQLINTHPMVHAQSSMATTRMDIDLLLQWLERWGVTTKHCASQELFQLSMLFILHSSCVEL